MICPHCGSTDIDLGLTGLNECNNCHGLNREGRKLTDIMDRNKMSDSLKEAIIETDAFTLWSEHLLDKLIEKGWRLES